MIEKLLFAFTFIFGILSFITKSKLFNIEIGGFFDTFYPYKLYIFFKWLDVVILILSLGYQAIYWLYK